MTRSIEQLESYIAEIEGIARAAAFGEDPAGKKWCFRGGMLAVIKGWYLARIPVETVKRAQIRAMREAGPGGAIRALFLHYKTLDRIVKQTWAGENCRKDYTGELPPEARRSLENVRQWVAEGVLEQKDLDEQITRLETEHGVSLGENGESNEIDKTDRHR